MEVFLKDLLTSIIIPPTLFIFLALLGLGVSLIWKKLGTIVSMVSVLALFLCSMPAVVSLLMDVIQPESALLEQNFTKSFADVDALVVLGGGRRSQPEEFDEDTASEYTLERIRYAAWIAKRTGLPLIVSGGRLNKENKSIAEVMRDILQKEFVVIVDHVEGASRNTYENAKYSAEILKDNKMKKIALITHAWHMPRAKKAFEFFGISVVPAPTAFYGRSSKWDSGDFIPSVNALMYSGFAFHEIFGAMWYDFRYY